MSKHLLAWSRRMSHSSWLAGVALVPGVLQAAQPPAPSAENTAALIVLSIAVLGPLVLGAGAGFVIWLISRGTPPAAIGALPPRPAKPREVLPPGVHLPPPSIRPLIMSIGLMVICFGVVLRNIAISITPDFNIPIVLVIGFLIMAAGLFGWIRDDYRAAKH
ncbi:MAG: hypothetical protein HY870_19440 [Chloroflexi bacterium]|nr:hypothetical protein [Chloroflexota bacterium]